MASSTRKLMTHVLLACRSLGTGRHKDRVVVVLTDPKVALVALEAAAELMAVVEVETAAVAAEMEAVVEGSRESAEAAHRTSFAGGQGDTLELLDPQAHTLPHLHQR